MGDEDEDNDASVEERSESSRVSRPKRKRGVKELEKFGDDVDSEENNQYNYDDESHLLLQDDPELTQLRDECDESLNNQSYQQTNSSYNTNLQFNPVPVNSQSQFTVSPSLAQVSNALSPQFTQYRKPVTSVNEPHQFHNNRLSNPLSTVQSTASQSNTPIFTQSLPLENDFHRATPSLTYPTVPEHVNPFIPIYQQELNRRRKIPSITQPLQQQNKRLLNQRNTQNKTYPPLNMNVKSNTKPTTRQSKSSTLNQLASSSSASSQLVDSDSDDADVFTQHTEARKRLRRKRG